MKYVLFFNLAIISFVQGLCQTARSTKGDYYTSPDKTRIYFEVTGGGDAVILVHGFVVDGESWKKTAIYTNLVELGFKVITMDLRGNGKSDKPHQPELYLNDIEAKDVMGIADKIGIIKYSVVGYSRGAIIASQLLVLDKRVTHAVIGGMGTDFMNPQWPRRLMFYEALSGIKPSPEVVGLIQRIKDNGLDQVALALMQYGQPSTSKEEFERVTKPVMVICGNKDTDNGPAKDLSNLIPGSTFATCPGNHGDALATPEFSTQVIAFVQGSN